jgi:DNA mismatch repair protein MutL
MFNLPPKHEAANCYYLSGKTNEKLVPVQEETEIVTIHGFIGKPEFAKKNRGEQFFFVNDRFIKAVICIMRLWLLTMAFTRRRTT